MNLCAVENGKSSQAVSKKKIQFQKPETHLFRSQILRRQFLKKKRLFSVSDFADSHRPLFPDKAFLLLRVL